MMTITLGVTDGNDTIGLQVITRAADSYDESGNGVKGGENPAVDIQGDVQPATGKMLKDLAEGVRDQVDHMVWTSYDLKNDHVVVYDGQRHRVVDSWPRRQDGFTKAAIGVIESDR